MFFSHLEGGGGSGMSVAIFSGDGLTLLSFGLKGVGGVICNFSFNIFFRGELDFVSLFFLYGLNYLHDNDLKKPKKNRITSTPLFFSNGTRFAIFEAFNPL